MISKLKSIEELLEEIVVLVPGMWVNENFKTGLLDDWFAVANDKGIIAYFGDETDAFRFRLDYINRTLNP